MSKLQQSTIFHAAVDSSEQTDRLINAGMGVSSWCKTVPKRKGPFYKVLFF